MVITPTLTNASGTWTLSQKHEQMSKTTQRKMLRLIVQTKRQYKTKKKKETKEEPVEDEKKHKEDDSLCVSDEETGEGSEQSSKKTKTAMFLSRKIKMRKLTNARKKKIGLNRSRGTHEKDENKLQDRNTQKNEVENGNENCNPRGRTMDKQDP